MVRGRVVYKRTPTLLVEFTRSKPPSSREPLDHSTHPTVNTSFLQYHLARHRAITYMEGPKSR
jgi:hypothetical protein